LTDGLFEIEKTFEEDKMPKDIDVSEEYQIIIELENENETSILYDKLTTEGYKCRVSIL